MNILILEDDPMDAELVQYELSRAGFIFSARLTGDKAAFLAALESFRPDLMLLDYSLPEFDGLTAVALARDRYEDIPAILVSGAIDEETAIEALNAGATDYVLKQRLRLLGPVVRRALQEAEQLAERKRAERALQLSEERYRNLVETASDAVIGITGNGLISLWNKKAEAIFGYSADETIGKDLHSLIVPETYREKAYTGLKTFIRTGEGPIIGRDRDVTALRKDGTTFPVELSVSATKTDEGWAALGIIRDVTERKKQEEELHRSEERFRDLVERLPVGLFETDRNLRLFFANRQAFEMFGFSPEDLAKGLSGLDLLTPEDRDRARANFAMRFRGEEPGTVEYQALKKDGSSFPILLHAAAIIKAGGIVGLQGIIVDNTERKRTEVEKARLEEQYHQAQRMESIGRLAGGVAHDLNNLLCPILGFGEVLRDNLSPKDIRRDDVDQILLAGNRARDLVRQLLAFSRKQTMEYQPVDMNAAVADFEKLLRRTIREDVAIRIVTSPESRLVMADPGQIEQVIMNLAVNAQDAMPEGGCLTIETAPIDLDEEYAATHPEVKPAPYEMLSISDTGTGIDDETRRQLFEPFFSTKGEMGTGLGLATVHGIVKQHGGAISVYSEPGIGTTFKVYLPVTDSAPIEEKPIKKDIVSLYGTETILLVEDNAQVLGFAHTILKKFGYTVLIAGNGPEALELQAAHEGPVDLLVTDVVLPGMNGKELFTKLAVRFAELKVLYMSGYSSEVIAHRGVLDEGIAFIQKPFTVQLLATRVREVLEG